MRTNPTDPVERLLLDDEAFDHARAKARGQRVRALANLIVSALDGHGVLVDQDKARVIVNSVLCDALYADAAVDVDPRQ